MAAPTLIAGVRATGDLATDREDIQFERGIFLLKRYRNPITTMVQRLATAESVTKEFNHWEDQLSSDHDQIDGALASTSQTTFTVDNPEVWLPGTLWQNQTDGDPGEIVLVTSVASAVVTVVRDFGDAMGASPVAFTDDAYFFRLSSAYEQGHPIPSKVSTEKVKVTNYCQDIRTAGGASEMLDASRLRGADEMPYEQQVKAMEHAEKFENMAFYGHKNAGSDSLYDGTTNSNPATTGGLEEAILENNDSDLIIDETDITMFEFLDNLEPIFEKGGKQSSERKFMFHAPRFQNALDSWGITKMQTFARDTVLGVNVGTWASGHGEIVFVKESRFTRNSSLEYYDNFFVDLEWMTWVVKSQIGSTRLREIGYEGNGGKTQREFEFQTIAGFDIKHAPTHARMRFKTYS